MERSKVYEVIDGERSYQDQKWGGEPHDQNHNVGDWIVYMEYHLNRAKDFYSTEFNSNEKTLDELRKVVALGVACFEMAGVPERKLLG